MKRFLRISGLALALVQAWPQQPVKLRISPSLVKTGMKIVVPPPRTPASKMNRPGPVISSDPYFTISAGSSVVYRDALDRTLAYYRPLVQLGTCSGTALAEGLGEIASKLVGFRFRYYKFESGEVPKWASLQAVIVVQKPPDVSLEEVRKKWPDVARLLPLPYKFEPGSGVRMTIAYPQRSVRFSEMPESGEAGETRWYVFSTNTKPTPADLAATADNNVLNEAKAKDFAALLISDLGDMPSFQPILEVKVVFAGWAGRSPLARVMPSFGLKPISLMKFSAAKAAATTPAKKTSEPPGGLRTPLLLGRSKTTPAAKKAEPATPTTKVLGGGIAAGAKKAPMAAVQISSKLRLRPDLVKVFGALRPKEDIDYSYSDRQEVVTKIPAGFPKDKTPDYDYYFLSDSGRFGGPFFEPSALPDRPQRAAGPPGFAGAWYESHFLGKRLIWPCPREMRLRWESAAGIRPSCRFSVSTGDAGKMTAHLTYDLYPDLALRAISAYLADLAAKTGEEIELHPFADLVDANQMSFVSGDPLLAQMLAQKALWISKLTPRTLDEAWFRLGIDLPVEDWAGFTRLMKAGDLGMWDFGLLTGATAGRAEKVSLRLSGNMLEAMGGPAAATRERLDPATGGFELSFHNFGIAPLLVKGVRFVRPGASPAWFDFWLDGRTVELPGLDAASSFDQGEGTGGGMSVRLSQEASPELVKLVEPGAPESVGLELIPEMVGLDPAKALDPDIGFAFLRSLCYQYVGSSEIIQVPVTPAEASQWDDYSAGTLVVRFMGFVYAKSLDLALPAKGEKNLVAMRRLPKEGVYALAGGGEAGGDVVEYRAWFTRKSDGQVVFIPPKPAAPEEAWGWSRADTTMILIDSRR